METALFLATETAEAKGDVAKMKRAVGDQDNLEWFKSLDLNGNGVLDPEEITPNFNNE